MTPVTLAIVAEQEALGFDMELAPHVGDIVTATYDFGCGPAKVTGTYEGIETRPSGEKFAWVREYDGTRYAIPTGFIEVIRVEAANEGIQVAPRPAAHQPHQETRSRARMHQAIDGLTRSAYGRSCARLDYEGRSGDWA